MTRTILLTLLLAGSLGAQTKHPIATKDSKQIGADLQTKPAENPSAKESPFTCGVDCISSGTLNIWNTDTHGCFLGASWDGGKEMCVAHIMFDVKQPVTCSPVAADADGTQHMICWYKPAPTK